jgi:NADH-quinone oxidoreductase subunit G
MPKLTIDGKECTFEGKKMIIQVANENGVPIPQYCYHPGLSIVASCRICLAEVAAPNPRNENKPELIPKLVPTCQTMAADGMIVHTQSPKAIANQKQVMENLLINHPLDCPVCDQAGECSLQDFSFKYGRGHSRFQEDKIKQPVKDIGTHVKLYSDRCIMCSRCVRFTREVTGTSELCVVGRGSKEQIDVFPGHGLENELSGNVIDLCPVGALLDKDFLFTQRVWFLSGTPSIDGITASGDNIRIDHNEGRVYRVKPRTNLDVNKWWISDEIRYGWKFVHSDERLRQPLRQQFGTQVTTDWSTALKEAAEGLRAVASRGKRIAVMLSPMLSCEDAYLLATFARSLDPQAVLALGPVPVSGQDKTFPGGYTVLAEKAPNARGVTRVIETFVGQGNSFDYAKLSQLLGDASANIEGLLLTGNYPSNWTTKEFVASIGKRFTVLIDTLPNDLTAKASVVLPGATWLEKAGTFENRKNVLQSFEQAIQPIEGSRAEGQIALDLTAAATSQHAAPFDAAAVREQLGGVFTTDVKHPSAEEQLQADMEYVEL